jgi:hypothetical protein
MSVVALGKIISGPILPLASLGTRYPGNIVKYRVELYYHWHPLALGIRGPKSNIVKIVLNYWTCVYDGFGCMLLKSIYY